MQLHDTILPIESDIESYLREVLQLGDGQTEAILDECLEREAERLGLSIRKQVFAKPAARLSSTCDSFVTAVTDSEGQGSTESHHSKSTALTSTFSSGEDVGVRSMIHRKSLPRVKTRSQSFSRYNTYFLQTNTQDASRTVLAVPIQAEPSLFSVSTRRSYASVKKSLKSRLSWGRRKSMISLRSCVCCRDEFKKSESLRTLPCMHNYCDNCLRVLVTQATTDEAKMPPTCCKQAIPGDLIKAILTPDQQHTFMQSVIHYSTPWESRIYCPSPSCGVFMPKPDTIDPKKPFEVSCQRCSTRACSICKGAAHETGRDCPSDWELETVLRMGERSGWKRCYKCRNLVSLADGCMHMTCRCKAQFCYLCGAVWDCTIGCPNYCNGDEEIERRRVEEEARVAVAEAERIAREETDRLEAAERFQAEKRTRESRELRHLRHKQLLERDRFLAFDRSMKCSLWTRHGKAKLTLLNHYTELEDKLRERHTRTSANLEDRQVAAEMELRSTLRQSERSVRIRLRHMESYCTGLGRTNGAGRMVTEKDLRELGQVYNTRDDMERMHQSKINVMREKQRKQMEMLLLRHEEELERLLGRQNEDLEALIEKCAMEEEEYVKTFRERKERLAWRWVVKEEIERGKLERKWGGSFTKMEEVGWPSPALVKEPLHFI